MLHYHIAGGAGRGRIFGRPAIRSAPRQDAQIASDLKTSVQIRLDRAIIAYQHHSQARENL
jgi:hypothetical protein